MDQRKIDARRDAWDRDYMPADWVKSEPKSDKRIENAKLPFLYLHFFILQLLVMMSSMK